MKRNVDNQFILTASPFTVSEGSLPLTYYTDNRYVSLDTDVCANDICTCVSYYWKLIKWTPRYYVIILYNPR